MADARMECSNNNRAQQPRRANELRHKSPCVTKKVPLPPSAPVPASSFSNERNERYRADAEKRRMKMSHRQRMSTKHREGLSNSINSQNSSGSLNENRFSPIGLESSSSTVEYHNDSGTVCSNSAYSLEHYSSESKGRHSPNTVNSGGKTRLPRDSSNYQRTRPVSEQLPLSIAQSSVPSSSVTRAESFYGRKEHLNHLVSMGFPRGLAKAVAENAQIFHHRLWVVDNSGSMQIQDGNLIEHYNDDKVVKARRVTRWEEIRETVRYHASMALSLNSPTTFKLLNDPGAHIGPQEFSVALDHAHHTPQEQLRTVEDTMLSIQPSGVTPLTRHIWEIQQMITSKAPELRREGKKVVLVIATDGLPTDEEGYGGESITDEFLRAIKSLENLPVWLVIRLCTDEQQVTKFYNSLDTELELSLEVIDDFVGEAQEVNRFNSWLNYCLHMHRVRELGYHDRLFDLIDERPLTKGEIRDFCCLVFGIDDFNTIPDPASNWLGFLKAINHLQKSEAKQWNPIKKKKKRWINLKQLNKIYGDGSKCTIS
jgi:hypothetical protein